MPFLIGHGLEVDNACIIIRRNCRQFRLDLGRDIQAINETRYGLGIDGAMGAGQGLEGLEGFRVTLAAQDGLQSFGHHGPVVVQVGLNGCFVEQ